MNKGFCYQENTHFSQAVACSREKFWGEIRKISTAWKIDSRRDILDVVERHDAEGMTRWLKHTEYQKFLAKKRGLKKAAARQKFFEKTDEERLLAFAQELKDNLPAFIFCCYEFDATETAKGAPFRHRRLADCHLNGLVMLDIDHVENPMAIWEKLKANEEMMNRTGLVHITSSKKGIRIVFTADIKEGNLADNQIVFAQALGYKADDSCIDATRNSFAPKEEDILYINEPLLFDYYNEDFDKKYTAEYRDKKTQPIYHKFPTDDGTDTGAAAQAAAVAGKTAESGPDAVRQMDDQEPVMWRGYDVQSIIDSRYAGHVPCKADSNRHNESLKLATDLLLMFDGDKALTQRTVERQPWVQEIIDERDENVAQTVESAAKQLAKREESTSQPHPSKAMQAAIEAVAGMPFKQIVSEGNEGAVSPVSKMDALLVKWGEEIEGMFNDFPMLKDVCAGLKRTQYPAAVFVAGGLMMTLMTRCWYRFYHRPQQERRLNCSLLVIGHPASNKSMADDLYKILAAPMVTADKAGKKALNRYKEDSKKKASNKEGKEKPKGLIRIHPARTSNGQLITDMLNAIEDVCGKEVQLHMFTFDTELDNSIQLQKGGSWIDKQTLELKAFHNEEDGQMYANLDSPVDNFNVTWNYIYTGTPLALKKKVNERNFGTGLSTRLAVLPMPKTNFEMIDFEEVQTTDWQRIERMKSWAFKLDTRMGELPVWDLVKRLYQWTKNRMADAQEDESEANELMLKRVPYHALNYAAPFIDMRHWDQIHQDGRYWTGEYETDETDWRLCELLANIQYATQQHFFGKMAEKYFDDMNSDVQTASVRHVRKTIEGYDRLPEVFTREDVSKCFGYVKKAAISMKIRRLLDQHLIEVVKEEKGQFKKTNQMLI